MEADLSDADFRGADLAGADLSLSILEGARLNESVGLPRFSTLEEASKRFEEAGCIGTITDSMVDCESDFCGQRRFQ